MGTGYVRNDTANNIADGNVINASDLDGEFDAIQSAFNASTGHSHDGTSGEGPQIDTAGIADDAITGAKIDSTTTVTAASFVGPVTGNVTGNLTGAVTGNASTATALQTARNIAGQSFNGTANISIAPTDLTGVTATATEINKLDGANVTTTEINIIDGDTVASSTVVADADRVVFNDAGTMKQVAMTDLNTYFEGKMDTLAGLTSTIAELNKLDGYTGTASDLNYAKDLNATGVTTAEFDKLDGLTATTTELNLLDGVTATTTELNYVDGVTSNIQTQLNAKVGSLSDLSITATATELNKLDGYTGSTAELNILDGVTATTAELNLMDGVTATTAEINYIDGVTSNIQTQLDAKGNVSTLSDLGVTATAAELNKLDNVTSSAAEFNVLDGDTSATATTLVDADRVVVNDNGTMVQVAMTDVKTYTNSGVVLDSDIGSTVQAYDADILKADTADTLTASFRGTVTTDNDLSFDMNVTNNFKCTPTSGAALTFTNITAGQSGNIWLDNSAGVTITAAATTYISGTDLTTISTAGVYFLSYYSDGTNVVVACSPALTSTGA